MRSERLFLNDPAFDAYRTLLDYRSRDFVGGNGVKSAFFKLVDISSASHSAEIDLFAHCRGREIDDKFAGILYQTVGVAFGAHRYIGYGRMCTDYSCPSYREDIRLFGCSAAYEGGRDGSEQCAAFPELF